MSEIHEAPIGDWLLDWFGSHPLDHIDEEGRPDGYSYAMIANCANHVADQLLEWRLKDAYAKHDKEMPRGWHTIKSVLLTELRCAATFHDCVAAADALFHARLIGGQIAREMALHHSQEEANGSGPQTLRARPETESCPTHSCIAAKGHEGDCNIPAAREASDE